MEKINLSTANKIGSGYFSSVYEYTIPRNGRTVAMRIVNRANGENNLAYTLEHPNILTVLDVFQAKIKGRLRNKVKTVEFYPLMESNLQKIVIDPERMFFILSQVIEGIRYLHSNHMAHRDLKPENVLVHNLTHPLNQWIVKITDLNISVDQAVGYYLYEDYRGILSLLWYCLEGCYLHYPGKRFTMPELYEDGYSFYDYCLFKNYLSDELIKK